MPCIRRFRLNLYSANTEADLERMDKGLVDVGLLLNPPIHEKYEYINLGYSDRFGLLMPKNCALAQEPWISVNDLKRLPLLVSAQTFSRFEQSSFPLSETEIRVVSCYNLIYNASYFVEQGLGYALTLEGLIDTSNRALTFRLIKPFIEAPWKLVAKKYLPQAPAGEGFYEFISRSRQPINRNKEFLIIIPAVNRRKDRRRSPLPYDFGRRLSVP